MAENSKIEWCDHTFNPWIGCSKVSPACDNCYAEAYDKRFGGERWGVHAPRRLTSDVNWERPLSWNRKAAKEGKRYRVFCASLADVFDNHSSIQPEWRARLWELIERTPNLDWLLLTKRPQNIQKLVPWEWFFPINVWIGTTVEDQKTADQRIKHLSKIPQAVRFLSCEPLIGPVDLTNVEWFDGLRFNALEGKLHGDTGYVFELEWVIAGGESGAKARPSHPDWFRSLRDQCASCPTPFLFKQWGNWVPMLDRDKDDPDWRGPYGRANSRPNQYRIINLEGGCGFHGERVHLMRRCTKRAAGRQLDGVEHTAFPNLAKEVAA
ncbi:phage Gp37/Gp68 family protein [Polycladidibacter hongkongensis]|uniref:phage Gp37/Gp68 family protein n=1 Tax=Polycladidibacter hongkongensis TaxID=1647556 RepID=UPI00082AD697|nr:phage Gp37/Gp68 family protein [Pseudovibrio hongkongensis]